MMFDCHLTFFLFLVICYCHHNVYLSYIWLLEVLLLWLYAAPYIIHADTNMISLGS
jgi:hypothetical protein